MAKSKDNPVKLGKGARLPTHDQIADLFQEMEAAGEAVPEPTPEAFRAWVKRQAEGSLWFFCRWIMGFKKVDSPFHREVCAWLTDFTRSHHKLLMLPVGHLKTSIVSHGMPLHILVQPEDGDLYFAADYSGGKGKNARIVLGAENQKKAAENLQVIKETFEHNPWLVWCWPDLVWENFHDAPKWANEAITVPRTRVFREPTITAYGVENAITGGHFDAIIPDDMATIKAGQSTVVMETVKTWLKRSFTRLHDRFESVHLGIGTHQSADDVYLDWQKRANIDVMVRAIEEKDENGELRPIWPEEWTPEKLKKLRDDTDAITWSLWYMNRPVTAGYSALQWEQVREFRWSPQKYGATDVEFDESQVDEELRKRREALASPLARFAAGLGLRPMAGGRERMLKRFGAGPDGEFAELMRDRYGQSPAQTPAKERLENQLARPPR